MSRFSPLLIAVALGASACASSPNGPPGGAAGVAPMLSVERFLQAANTGDLESMARIFGTADGSIAERRGSAFGCAFKRMGSWFGIGDHCISREEIELRMNAIALIVQSDDYQVRSGAPVAGRTRPTTRVGVDIQRGSERFTDVPFTVVQTSDGRWLVEEIDLARLTAESPLPLDELPEHATGAAGMDERDEVAASAAPWDFVDELEPLVLETGKRLGNVGNAVREVM